MNFFKKILFSSLAIAFISSISISEISAQPPEGSNKQNKEKMQERMTAYNAMLDSLGLTEQQREDVEFINTKYKAQMQQIRQNNEGDREAMRPKMMELRDKQNAELKEVFNEEQFAEYQKWQKENRSRRKGGPPKN